MDGLDAGFAEGEAGVVEEDGGRAESGRYFVVEAFGLVADVLLVTWFVGLEGEVEGSLGGEWEGV